MNFFVCASVVLERGRGIDERFALHFVRWVNATKERDTLQMV